MYQNKYKITNKYTGYTQLNSLRFLKDAHYLQSVTPAQSCHSEVLLVFCNFTDFQKGSLYSFLEIDRLNWEMELLRHMISIYPICL